MMDGGIWIEIILVLHYKRAQSKEGKHGERNKNDAFKSRTHDKPIKAVHGFRTLQIKVD